MTIDKNPKKFYDIRDKIAQLKKSVEKWMKDRPDYKAERKVMDSAGMYIVLNRFPRGVKNSLFVGVGYGAGGE